MSSKNKQVIIAYFDGEEEANKAADQLKDWDKANDTATDTTAQEEEK